MCGHPHAADEGQRNIMPERDRYRLVGRGRNYRMESIFQKSNNGENIENVKHFGNVGKNEELDIIQRFKYLESLLTNYIYHNKENRIQITMVKSGFMNYEESC